MAAVEELPPELLVGRYQFEYVLGTGGMGVVYRGLDSVLERTVALKILHPNRSRDPSFRSMFAAEARAMAKVRHPNVVEIHDFGEHETRPFIVMEYVDGTDLRTWSSVRGRLQIDRALDVADQLCRGVQAIHDAGVVHRDIKPSNILLDTSAGFRVAVADLGLGALRESHPGASFGPVGTPSYMAPEVVLGQEVPRRLAHVADVYSLGVICFELLAGRLPFITDSARDAMRKHAHARPPALTGLRPEVHPAFDTLFRSVLDKNPGERIASAEELRQRLARIGEAVRGPALGLRILIADDDESSREATAQYMELAMPGAETVQARDGRDALAIALANPPHVVVTDLSMPKMDGVALTAALRERDQTRHVPIIVVTGIGGAPDWQLLRRIGASSFLVKPVELDALVAEIQRLTPTEHTSHT